MSKTAAVLAARDLLPGTFGASAPNKSGKNSKSSKQKKPAASPSEDEAATAEEDQSESEASDASQSDDEEENNDDDDDDEDIQPREDVVDDLNYDLFNLLTCNYHAIRVMEGETQEDVLRESAERSTRLIIKRLMELPTEASDVGALTVLPEEIQRFPRSTKIAEKKPETKWEKFAREKGIKNKKRDRMVFDEDAQEFRPRFGYKRANGGVEDVPIVEVKPGQDPFADPWSEARSDKKARVKKNKKNQLKNIGRATKKTGRVNSYDPESIPGIPANIGAKSMKRGKGGLRAALQLAQHSTQSLGRFDERLKGEPEIKMSGRKRSFRDNFSSQADKDSMKSQLRFVADKSDKKARGVTNSLAAYEGILPDAPSDRFKQKKGKGKGNNSADSGSSKKKRRK